jgi:hypothetical protein
MYSLFLYIFALHVSGAICTHPQEHKLQSAAIDVCDGYGMLIHWSRYWLGHPHTHLWLHSAVCAPEDGCK